MNIKEGDELEEIVTPIRRRVKARGITRKDLKRIIREVREKR